MVGILSYVNSNQIMSLSTGLSIYIEISSGKFRLRQILESDKKRLHKVSTNLDIFSNDKIIQKRKR